MLKSGIFLEAWSCGKFVACYICQFVACFICRIGRIETRGLSPRSHVWYIWVIHSGELSQRDKIRGCLNWNSAKLNNLIWGHLWSLNCPFMSRQKICHMHMTIMCILIVVVIIGPILASLAYRIIQGPKLTEYHTCIEFYRQDEAYSRPPSLRILHWKKMYSWFFSYQKSPKSPINVWKTITPCFQKWAVVPAFNGE